MTTASPKIVETLAGQFFQVFEPKFSGLAHSYIAIEAQRTKAGFVPKKNAKEILIRKFGTREVAAWLAA